MTQRGEGGGPRILVTGGAGYIGAHACKALARGGYTPVTFDNLSRGHASAVRWGPLEVGDILDRARLDAAVARYHPFAALHFAAFTSVAESVVDPALYWRNNVEGTLALVEVLRAHKVRRLVFSSSASVYGTPDATPVPEDAPLRPINPYGRSKQVMEAALRDYAAAYGFSVVALRYFNAAGADPDGEIGEDHDPETHLIPLALQAAATGGTFTLNGGDYPTPDGTCVRDFVHVADLAEAHVLALRSLADHRGFAGYNLGAGRGVSVNEVIEAVRRRTGRPLALRIGPRRPGDPAVLTASAVRARAELGWRPRLSEIETIVDTAWRWLIRRPGLDSPSDNGEDVGAVASAGSGKAN